MTQSQFIQWVEDNTLYDYQYENRWKEYGNFYICDFIDIFEDYVKYISHREYLNTMEVREWEYTFNEFKTLYESEEL